MYIKYGYTCIHELSMCLHILKPQDVYPRACAPTINMLQKAQVLEHIYETKNA